MGMERIEMKAVLGLIILALLTRLMPHPPNFAPITGIALFSGYHFVNKRIALFIPLAALFISDLFIRNKKDRKIQSGGGRRNKK
jgi:hypothetical protein